MFSASSFLREMSYSLYFETWKCPLQKLLTLLLSARFRNLNKLPGEQKKFVQTATIFTGTPASKAVNTTCYLRPIETLEDFVRNKLLFPANETS